MTDYERIAKAIDFIVAHAGEQPALDDIARHLHLSSYHFHRLFSRWAGISPKRFLQVLTVSHAKALLRKSSSLLEVTGALGLSSSARLHDHFIALEAATPGQFKRRGLGLRICHGSHETPFGPAFVAGTEHGICQLSFLPARDAGTALAELKSTWDAAQIVKAPDQTERWVAAIFRDQNADNRPLSLLVSGTNSQVNVWRAQLRIPPGLVATYGQVASMIGKPHASRAVGQAVGANPVSLVIPCHRVIRSSGVIGNYRWGSTRKRAMLARESAGNTVSDSESA